MEELMAEVTAALVKELREKSGVGMMDCKKALVRWSKTTATSKRPSTGCARRVCPRPPRRLTASPPKASWASWSAPKGRG
jgi:hypothetical protein